jgi:hypothetical protein
VSLGTVANVSSAKPNERRRHGIHQASAVQRAHKKGEAMTGRELLEELRELAPEVLDLQVFLVDDQECTCVSVYMDGPVEEHGLVLE